MHENNVVPGPSECRHIRKRLPDVPHMRWPTAVLSSWQRLQFLGNMGENHLHEYEARVLSDHQLRDLGPAGRLSIIEFFNTPGSLNF